MNENVRKTDNLITLNLVFRALATKISLDQQGRLVHRETGKIILPYEHFANAVILKVRKVPKMKITTLLVVRFEAHGWTWRHAFINGLDN